MLRLKTVVCSIFALLLFGIGTVYATPYYAVTDQFGYSGTVTYVPLGGTDTVTVSTSGPRDGYVYITNDAGTTDWNIFMSNWYEHPPSNVHDSFFQLYDENADSVTSSYGRWDGALSSFTLQVTGANAAYTDDPATNDSSRAWMPDQNVASRGTWLDYELTLSANGMSVVEDNGWYVNDTDPTSITGTFRGTFLSADYTSTTTGITTYANTYYVELELASDLFDAVDFTGTPSNYFGAPVPEPATMLLLGTGLIGMAGVRRKMKK